MATAQSEQADHSGGGLNSALSSWQTASPFNPMERYQGDFRCICADLRNANPGKSSGPLEIDRRSRRVTVDGRELDLAPREYDLLALLASDPGAVFTRERIIDEVWDPNWWGSTKTLDVHVAAVRRKLGDASWIATIRGVGYRFDPR